MLNFNLAPRLNKVVVVNRWLAHFLMTECNNIDLLFLKNTKVKIDPNTKPPPYNTITKHPVFQVKKKHLVLWSVFELKTPKQFFPVREEPNRIFHQNTTRENKQNT